MEEDGAVKGGAVRGEGERDQVVVGTDRAAERDEIRPDQCSEVMRKGSAA